VKSALSLRFLPCLKPEGLCPKYTDIWLGGQGAIETMCKTCNTCISVHAEGRMDKTIGYVLAGALGGAVISVLFLMNMPVDVCLGLFPLFLVGGAILGGSLVFVWMDTRRE